MKVEIPKSLIFPDASNEIILVAVKNFSSQGEKEDLLVQSFRSECQILRHLPFFL